MDTTSMLHARIIVSILGLLCMIVVTVRSDTDDQVKAKMYEISRDTHQFHYILLYHFTI